MAAHSSVLGWRIPWTEEPGGHSPRGRKASATTEATEQAGTPPSLPPVRWCLLDFVQSRLFTLVSRLGRSPGSSRLGGVTSGSPPIGFGESWSRRSGRSTCSRKRPCCPLTW